MLLSNFQNREQKHFSKQFSFWKLTPEKKTTENMTRNGFLDFRIFAEKIGRFEKPFQKGNSDIIIQWCNNELQKSRFVRKLALIG